jgi:sugar phosphate isomerase/epimerase
VRILAADWNTFDVVLPIALRYQIGIEVQEYTRPNNIDHNRSMAKDIGEQISTIPLRGFHGPYLELVPASQDPKVRDVARSRFQDAYDLAKVVDAQHLILHTGYFPKTYPREIWVQNSLEFWIDFLSDKHGPVNVHIENVYEDDYSGIAELLDRVNEALNEEKLTACLDIGHVHSNSSKALEEWITNLGNRIRYVHLNNNDGIVDDHWGLWKGKIDIVHVLDLLMKHSPASVWTVETLVSDIEQSVEWLKEKGYVQPA